jgi:hypothetical protein
MSQVAHESPLYLSVTILDLRYGLGRRCLGTHGTVRTARWPLSRRRERRRSDRRCPLELAYQQAAVSARGPPRGASRRRQWATLNPLKLSEQLFQINLIVEPVCQSDVFPRHTDIAES